MSDIERDFPILKSDVVALKRQVEAIARLLYQGTITGSESGERTILERLERLEMKTGVGLK